MRIADERPPFIQKRLFFYNVDSMNDLHFLIILVGLLLNDARINTVDSVMTCETMISLFFPSFQISTVSMHGQGLLCVIVKSVNNNKAIHDVQYMFITR